MKPLFALDPAADVAGAAARFAATGRAQLRGVLTDATARELQGILARGTRWGMSAQAGTTAAPRFFAQHEMAGAGTAAVNTLANAAAAQSAQGEYGFRFASYPIVRAVQERWPDGAVHEMILEHLNAPPFLDLARAITAIPDLVKADGQATLFAANHYLGRHIDSHVAEGWRVAYVLNLAREDWHPDWGGYLLFLDEDGDVVEGFRPRFNALNLFAVPQSHLVSYVPPFAPLGRFAITGWLRDR